MRVYVYNVVRFDAWAIVAIVNDLILFSHPEVISAFFFSSSYASRPLGPFTRCGCYLTDNLTDQISCYLTARFFVSLGFDSLLVYNYAAVPPFYSQVISHLVFYFRFSVFKCSYTQV